MGVPLPFLRRLISMDDIEILTEEEAAELIIEVEDIIEYIRNGEMDGEYFEF